MFLSLFTGRTRRESESGCRTRRRPCGARVAFPRDQDRDPEGSAALDRSGAPGRPTRSAPCGARHPASCWSRFRQDSEPGAVAEGTRPRRRARGLVHRRIRGQQSRRFHRLPCRRGQPGGRRDWWRRHGARASRQRAAACDARHANPQPDRCQRGPLHARHRRLSLPALADGRRRDVTSDRARALQPRYSDFLARPAEPAPGETAR